MNFYKKIMTVLYLILAFGCCTVLSACAFNERISLEEALAVKEKNTDIANQEEDPVGAQEGETEVLKQEESDLNGDLLYVYVCGSVEKPGVYALEKGSRIVAAIEAAGGFLSDAATESINLAAPLSDGMQIVVPDIEEAVMLQVYDQREQDGQVNLNTASVKDLCSLQGIGEAKAEAIIAYREEIGAYTSIEQIKNVTGIGDNLFKQIKESIYIE